MGEKRKREHGSEQSWENPGGLGRQGRGSDDEPSWVGAPWRRGLASALRAPALAPDPGGAGVLRKAATDLLLQPHGRQHGPVNPAASGPLSVGTLGLSPPSRPRGPLPGESRACWCRAPLLSPREGPWGRPCALTPPPASTLSSNKGVAPPPSQQPLSPPLEGAWAGGGAQS